MKKNILLFLLFGLPLLAWAQKPAYCNELPVSYEKSVALPGAKAAADPVPLPRFATQPFKEYKIQVAILKFSNPADFPFHPSLIARYRPCEEVWVIESRKSFRDRKDAEALRAELIRLGYRDAYITELIGYE